MLAHVSAFVFGLSYSNFVADKHIYACVYRYMYIHAYECVCVCALVCVGIFKPKGDIEQQA